MFNCARYLQSHDACSLVGEKMKMAAKHITCWWVQRGSQGQSDGEWQERKLSQDKAWSHTDVLKQLSRGLVEAGTVLKSSRELTLLIPIKITCHRCSGYPHFAGGETEARRLMLPIQRVAEVRFEPRWAGASLSTYSPCHTDPEGRASGGGTLSPGRGPVMRRGPAVSQEQSRSEREKIYRAEVKKEARLDRVVS